jgi:hypothetical protein
MQGWRPAREAPATSYPIRKLRWNHDFQFHRLGASAEQSVACGSSTTKAVPFVRLILVFLGPALERGNAAERQRSMSNPVISHCLIALTASVPAAVIGYV